MKLSSATNYHDVRVVHALCDKGLLTQEWTPGTQYAKYVVTAEGRAVLSDNDGYGSG